MSPLAPLRKPVRIRLRRQGSTRAGGQNCPYVRRAPGRVVAIFSTRGGPAHRTSAHRRQEAIGPGAQPVDVGDRPPRVVITATSTTFSPVMTGTKGRSGSALGQLPLTWRLLVGRLPRVRTSGPEHHQRMFGTGRARPNRRVLQMRQGCVIPPPMTRVRPARRTLQEAKSRWHSARLAGRGRGGSLGVNHGHEPSEARRVSVRAGRSLRPARTAAPSPAPGRPGSRG